MTTRYCACGTPLECYEGETYCPDCTRYAAERDIEQALDEALALRRQEAEMAQGDDAPAEDDLPF
jgi:uncharacterized Zn finger protein (UPF0148 family)